MRASDESGDLMTGEYAADFHRWSRARDSEPETSVLREAVTGRDGVLLEVGCGTGRVTFDVAEACSRLVAVDAEPTLIRFCRRRRRDAAAVAPERLRFEVQDACDLPYADEYFDGIVDSWTFTTLAQACDHPETEYRRVVSPGAPVVVLVERDSEFQRVLSEFIPTGYAYDPEAVVERSLGRVFGPPVRVEPIHTEYEFSSRSRAVETVEFVLREWMGIGLTAADRDSLRAVVGTFASDSGVTLSENSLCYEFRA